MRDYLPFRQTPRGYGGARDNGRSGSCCVKLAQRPKPCDPNLGTGGAVAHQVPKPSTVFAFSSTPLGEE